MKTGFVSEVKTEGCFKFTPNKMYLLSCKHSPFIDLKNLFSSLLHRGMAVVSLDLFS